MSIFNHLEDLVLSPRLRRLYDVELPEAEMLYREFKERERAKNEKI